MVKDRTVSYVCRRCEGRVTYTRRGHVYRHAKHGADHAPIPVEVRTELPAPDLAPAWDSTPYAELIGDLPGRHELDGGPLSELERRYAYGDR